jgi:hypothetical protein
MTRRSRPLGRYDQHRSAHAPANGLARAPSPNIRTAVAAVPDPLEPGARILATVNRRTDVLENERSHGRISEAAYAVGRILQQAFERQARIGASPIWNESGRIDAASRHDLAFGRSVDDARKVLALMRRVQDAVGVAGARFLRQVIGERVSFAAYAAARGHGGDRGTAQVAAHFRLLIEDLADHFGTAGPMRSGIRAERDG